MLYFTCNHGLKDNRWRGIERISGFKRVDFLFTPFYHSDNTYMAANETHGYCVWTPSTTHDADRRRALNGTQPVSAKQASSLFITLILLL